MILGAIFHYIYDQGFLYQLLVTLTTLLTIKLVTFVRQRHKRYQLFKYYNIPGPEQSLYDGNLSELLKKNDASGKALTYHKHHERFKAKYGKYFGIFVGDEPNIMITDLELLRRLFFEETESFKERTAVFFELTLFHGILFARYPRWKVMRKVLSPSFSAYTMRGNASSLFMENTVKLMIEYIEQKLNEAKSSNKTATTIDILNLMKATSLHLISAMAIKLPNVSVTENDENVKSLDSFMANVDSAAYLIPIRMPFLKPIMQLLLEHFSHNHALALIHRGLNKVIDEGLSKLSKKANFQSEQQQPQLIDTLIKLHYEGKITKREVMGNAESILFAGYDTTSTTMTYILWVVAKYPDVQDHLRDEIMAHGVESTYLFQVISETMRLYPTAVAFTTRLATKTVKVGELVIPQGCRIMHNTWLMHRNPDIWPNPERFDPERFKEGTDIHPCAYAPFGLGERKCLGYQLAILEMKLITCDILLRYKLMLKSPQDLELMSYSGFLTKPRDKVTIEFERL